MILKTKKKHWVNHAPQLNGRVPIAPIFDLHVPYVHQ